MSSSPMSIMDNHKDHKLLITFKLILDCDLKIKVSNLDLENLQKHIERQKK